jgi:hypothetical protein
MKRNSQKKYKFQEFQNMLVIEQAKVYIMEKTVLMKTGVSEEYIMIYMQPGVKSTKKGSMVCNYF